MKTKKREYQQVHTRAEKKPFPKWPLRVAAVVLVAVIAVLLWTSPNSSPALTAESETTVQTVFDTIGVHAGHEWVDLGLSVMWATCNVGATSPEGHGDYFAWGETSPKSEYIWSNLKYCKDEKGDSFSKYNYDQRGTRDKKKSLELSDDAARANWGGSWRMPTRTELKELIYECDWTWTTLNGENGYKVTSRSNGNSIFLPAAGCRNYAKLYNGGTAGHYWASSLDEGFSYYAKSLLFESDHHSLGSSSRHSGLPVRPVCR